MVVEGTRIVSVAGCLLIVADTPYDAIIFMRSSVSTSTQIAKEGLVSGGPKEQVSEKKLVRC